MKMKSSFLSSVRPFFDAPNEGKTPAEKEREKVVMNKQPNALDKEEKEEEKEDDKKEEKEEEKDDNKEEEKDDDEKDDEKEDDKEEEEKEPTAEELKATIKKLEKQNERAQKRIGRTQAERDAAKKELNEAKSALEAKLKDGEVPLTEEEVNRRAAIIAQQTVSDNEFSRIEKSLVKGAEKIDPDFIKNVREMAAEVGAIPPFIIEALNDVDEGNGGAVLEYLTKNVDEYEEIYKMIAEQEPPIKVIKKIEKLSTKLAEAAKIPPKKISKAPAPPVPPKGNASNPDTLDPKNIDEYVRIRNKQDADKRARGRL